MKPAPFRYHRAHSAAEAAGLLAEKENARLMAGGQSLMPMMNMRYVAVDHLIDLNPAADMAGIAIKGGRAEIGAMTRQRAILEHGCLASGAPVISEALRQVGHVQTRNRGTIGGSLSHLDPAAELPGMMALLDAEVTLTRKSGTRTVAMADFPAGYMTPCTAPDEVLSSIAFDLWPAGHGWDFREFARRHGDFAIVGVGSLLNLDKAGKIGRAALVLIGVGDGPRRLPEVETMLTGETPSPGLFAEAAELAGAGEMAEDALVSATYRRHLAKVLVRRSLDNAAQRARGGNNG